MKISKLQLVYLSALSMLGFIATDMYLPAFKLIEQDFATIAPYTIEEAYEVADAIEQGDQMFSVTIL